MLKNYFLDYARIKTMLQLTIACLHKKFISDK